MQATQSPSSSADRYAPRWAWWTLVLGAVLLVAWALFLLSFLSEPSAVGRSRALLTGVAGTSLGVAGLGAVAAAGLLRRARWAPRLTAVVAGLMILTIVGAIAGVPLAFGLLAGRSSKLS